MPLVKDLNELPTLNMIALLKTSVHLWQSEDIRPLVVQCTGSYPQFSGYYPQPIHCQDIHEKVASNLESLRLPDNLKNELRNAIRHVGDVLDAFLYFSIKPDIGIERGSMSINRDFIKGYLNKLKWTSHGMIDMGKMIRMLLYDDRLELKLRFEIACKCCMEDEVRRLWALMSPKRLAQNESLLTKYWVYLMKGKLRLFKRYLLDNTEVLQDRNCANVNKDLFRLSFLFGTSHSMEYFWTLLNAEERSDALTKFVPRRAVLEFSFENWYSLFLKLELDLAVEFILEEPTTILGYLMDAPYPYWPMFKRIMWILWGNGRFKLEDYFTVLKYCADGVYGHQCVENIFVFLWKGAPENYRNYVLNDKDRFEELMENLDVSHDVAERCAALIREEKFK